MKNEKLIFTFLFLLIKLYNITSQIFEVTPIYPYCINGTAFISNLEDYKEDYLYFIDSFYDSCNYDDYYEEKDEVKYYNLNSDINIINSSSLLYYTMSEKNRDSLTKIELIKDLNWEPIKSLILNETKKDYYSDIGFNWYYKIKKEENKNMILFRVAKNGNLEGKVSMYTLPEKPNYISETYEETDKSDNETDEKIDEQTNKPNETDMNKETDVNETKIDLFINRNSSNYLSKTIYILLILFFNWI